MTFMKDGKNHSHEGGIGKKGHDKGVGKKAVFGRIGINHAIHESHYLKTNFKTQQH